MTGIFDLKDKVVLVLGGSGGIGRVLCRGFAEAGARVVLTGRDPAKLEDIVADPQAAGSTVSGYRADVTDLSCLEPLIEKVAAEAGRLDILVNCQGINIIKPATDFSPADYDAVLDTNLKSVFFACLAARRRFLSQEGGGTIINIASLAAHRGWPGAVPYSMSKHGVAALTKGLASEWATEGIRVNAISPGFFMTDMNRDRMSAERKASALARTPMHRFGEVEELVGAALYLASDAARFVTGADIAVDGGFLASGI